MSLHPLCVRSCGQAWSRARWGIPDRRQEARTEAQWIVVRVADAEHPLVAAYAPHAAAYLVGKRLEAERPVTDGQRTGDGGAGALFGLGSQKNLDGFLEAAFQQKFIAGEWDKRRCGSCRQKGM